MAISTYQGTVEHGQIRLLEDVLLPEKATVYVVAPDNSDARPAQILSPKLVDPRQANRFDKQVIEAGSDAQL